MFCCDLLTKAGGDDLVGKTLLTYWYEALPEENEAKAEGKHWWRGPLKDVGVW
jgi:hypothetical protein